jgi:hypothetical protein
MYGVISHVGVSEAPDASTSRMSLKRIGAPAEYCAHESTAYLQRHAE